MEEAIEKDLIGNVKCDMPTGEGVGVINTDTTSVKFWLSHLAKVAGENTSPRRMKIALDCANGALSNWAPKFFSDLGYSVDAIGTNPDGINIDYVKQKLNTNGDIGVIEEVKNESEEKNE